MSHPAFVPLPDGRLKACPACGLRCTLGTDETTIRNACDPGRLDAERNGLRPPLPPRLPCIHRGEESRREECATCQGRVQVKVFGCALHGECTLEKPLAGVRACKTCPDWTEPEPTVSRLNLIYHVTPVASNDVWRRNVRQILHRMPLFNGRRIVGIAENGRFDPPEFRLDPPEAVMEAFAGHDCIFIVRPNSKKLREVVTFAPMMRLVESLDPTEATFYAHAKGVTRAGGPLELGVERHRNMMYHQLLDDPPKMRRLLDQFSMVGTTRFRHPDGNPFWKSRLADSTWHFSGTYWWFRNADLFALDWERVLRTHQHGWLIEALPGLLFPFERGFCVAYDGPRDVYGAATYADEPIHDGDPL